MFLALDLGETVNSAIENGIDLIENGSLNPNNIDVALLTLIAQLLATTVLFLVVRFNLLSEFTTNWLTVYPAMFVS